MKKYTDEDIINCFKQLPVESQETEVMKWINSSKPSFMLKFTFDYFMINITLFCNSTEYVLSSAKIIYYEEKSESILKFTNVKNLLSSYPTDCFYYYPKFTKAMFRSCFEDINHNDIVDTTELSEDEQFQCSLIYSKDKMISMKIIHELNLWIIKFNEKFCK